MIRLAIIADDLTGALDTGIKFSKMGIGTQVMAGYKFYDEDVDQSKEILVIDTESRHVPVNEAYARVYYAVKVCQDLKVPYYYKKTDSALRGHVGSEMAALYDLVGKKIAFIPALPCEKRITVKGVHYIDGSPVSESAFGRDPLNPVRHSDVAELIGEETLLSVRKLGRPYPKDLPPEQLLVFDAATDQDMEGIADYLKEQDCLGVTAGCAGFAQSLSGRIPFEKSDIRAIPETKKLFVICGSVNDVSKKQVLYAAGHGYRRISLNQEQKLGTDYPGSQAQDDFLKEVREICRRENRLVIDVFSEDTIGDALDYADSQGIEADLIPERIADRLGELARDIAWTFEDATLLIIGGDTLYSFVQKLESPMLDPVGEPLSGTVCMYVKAEGHVFPLISKSGGFGGEDLIIETERIIMKREVTENEEKLS